MPLPLDPATPSTPWPESQPELPVETPETAPEAGEEPVKGKVQDWQGGMPVKLNRKMSSGKTLEEELSAHIKETLDLEVKNQEELLKRIQKWEKNYRGIRDAKTFPFEGVANTASSLTRSDSDAIEVRCYDALTNKRRFFLMKPKGVADETQKNYVKTLEMAFDHYLRHQMKFKQKLRPAIRRAVKYGTGVLKIVYEADYRTITRFAQSEELSDETITKYRLPGTTDLGVKERSLQFMGPNIYDVPRDEFVISSDARGIDDAYMAGFCFTLRKPQLKVRGNKKYYIKDNVEKVTADDLTDAQKELGTLAGIDRNKTKYEEPYRLWELWFSYDVDEDDEEDDIVVVFHRESGTILKAIYNPLFYGYRPFVALIGNPQEGVFDGEGVCAILEATQEEVDAFHNLRLDRLAQINLPVIMVRSGMGLNDFKLTPGKTWIVDDDLELALRVINFPDVYHSTFEEEDRLVASGDRAVGISPNVLGMSSAERPVAKETMANLEEANKKFKNWIENFRQGILEVGYRLLECFSQHQPMFKWTENGQEQSVTFPIGNIRDLIELDLEVSTEQMNMEVRREQSIVKYQMLSDYMTKVAGMVQAFCDPNVPSDFKKFILEVNRIGVQSLNAVMEDFDERAPEEVVPDIAKVVDVQTNLMRSADLMAPPPPAGGPVPPGTPGEAPPPGPGPNPGPVTGPPEGLE